MALFYTLISYNIDYIRKFLASKILTVYLINPIEMMAFVIFEDIPKWIRNKFYNIVLLQRELVEKM